MAGINYLIQPVELLGTDRYKIGTSSSLDGKRVIKGYNNNTDIICILKSNNHRETEYIIKNKFSELYELVGGNETFKGDIINMTKTFIEIILSFNSVNLEVFNMEKTITGVNKKIQLEFNKLKGIYPHLGEFISYDNDISIIKIIPADFFRNRGSFEIKISFSNLKEKITKIKKTLKSKWFIKDILINSYTGFDIIINDGINGTMNGGGTFEDFDNSIQNFINSYNLFYRRNQKKLT